MSKDFKTRLMSLSRNCSVSRHHRPAPLRRNCPQLRITKLQPWEHLQGEGLWLILPDVLLCFYQELWPTRVKEQHSWGWQVSGERGGLKDKCGPQVLPSCDCRCLGVTAPSQGTKPDPSG